MILFCDFHYRPQCTLLDDPKGCHNSKITQTNFTSSRAGSLLVHVVPSIFFEDVVLKGDPYKIYYPWFHMVNETPIPYIVIAKDMEE